MKNIPEMIYLNLGDKRDVGDYDDFNILRKVADVTWCEYGFDETDVEYQLVKRGE